MHIGEANFGNMNCIWKVNHQGNRKEGSGKGYKMFECEMIEMEDFSFNHLIRHYDDCDCEQMHFNDEFECIEVLADCCEEILWN